VIGGYASSLWLFLLAFVPNQRKWWKAGLGIFLIISVVISGARAQVAGLLVSALLYFSIIRRWNPFLLVTAVLALVAGYMMIFQYGIADQIPQLYRFSPEYTANQFQTVVEGVSQSRLGIYQASLKLMLQNPILGVGPATDDELKQLLTRYMNFVYYDARAGTEAAFANTLAIYGLPTFLIFIIAMVTALYRAFAVYNRSEISENHQLILFCILFVALQLFYNLSGGNAKGGGLDFYVFLSLIDVIYIGLISRPINQKLEDPR
jgi:O-antigen ligase